MGKPSRTRDLIGAVLLVLVGLLYMTGVTHVTLEHAAGSGGAAGVVDASTEVDLVRVDYRT